MFDTQITGAEMAANAGLVVDSSVPDGDRWTPDELEQALIGLEAEIARLRHRQLGLLARLDVAQVAAADGSRSLQEWTAARLDVTPEMGRDLTYASRSITRVLNDELSEGDITFGRAVATARLAHAGAPQRVIDGSAGHDISGVRRLTSRYRSMQPQFECGTFDSRYAAIQLSLDNTTANISAKLTGTDSQVVTDALQQWADRFPSLPDGTRDTRAHRQADAFVAIFAHALAGEPGNDATSEAGGRGPHLLLTADLALLAASGGTAGAEVVGGPRIGINALEEALCNGSVSLDVTLVDGRVLGLGSATDPIPPRVRQHVLARDGACTGDACRSRYRLQVHHIIPRSRGGTHDPNNLTSLCWYHHHVVIHGKGYTIDPESPLHRRRFKRPPAQPRAGPP